MLMTEGCQNDSLESSEMRLQRSREEAVEHSGSRIDFLWPSVTSAPWLSDLGVTTLSLSVYASGKSDTFLVRGSNK